MPNTQPRAVPTDASILLMGMDLEGALRFHAEAVRLAPSGVVTPGLDYAELWQGEEEDRADALRRACDLLDLAAADDRLAAGVRTEIAAGTASMRAATEGRHVPDTFHLLNWNDKPHRLMYDANDLMIRAADGMTDVEDRSA